MTQNNSWKSGSTIRLVWWRRKKTSFRVPHDNATTRRTMPVPTLDGTTTIGAAMRNDQVIMGIADEWREKFGAVPFNKRHGRFPFTWRVMRRLAELEHIGQADLKEGPLFHSVAQTFRDILMLERCDGAFVQWWRAGRADVALGGEGCRVP